METIQESLKYERKLTQDLWKIHSESDARALVWGLKLGKEGFVCGRCKNKSFWEHSARSEIRECKSCGAQHRVRAKTIFEHSKIPLLIWIRAISLVMQDKRGVSALSLKRQLGLCSMATSWLMLMKIRQALLSRDAIYTLEGVIELDGGYFTKDKNLLRDNPHRGNIKTPVLVAVEQKSWIDEKGRTKSKAGFAKVMVDTQGQETKNTVQSFIKQSIKPRSILKTDGKTSYKNIQGYRTNSKSLTGDSAAIQSHLPWVHKFISNAKTWLLGTHHGRINSKYLPLYLAEYTYRFNRRHDPASLFSRSLAACVIASPIRKPALTGNA